jgi:hypothetical protein
VLDPNPPKPIFCGDPCDIDPGLCINGGLPTDIASGSLAKRDLAIVPGTATHELEKRRSVNLDDQVAVFLAIVQIILRAAFPSGEYFDNARHGAPVQGLYIQEAPINPPANGGNGIQGCQNGGLRLVPMTQQNQLATYNAAYRPQTEHPIDVSDAAHSSILPLTAAGRPPR